MKHIKFSPNGDSIYYENNLSYKYSGYYDGSLMWQQYCFLDGDSYIIHRLDGAALIYPYEIRLYYKGTIYWGDKFYFYRGDYIKCNSDEEWIKIMKLKAFL